ncbi:PREDICTED: uncharacterized protein LOC109115081 [Nelumbo nucifera]|uniref:Uncharacterized protein LOC109115081 n=1 Tax=Nelumbo nucifera TaxID=4432 RepID=A0A1U8Q6R9_NELNU|nr:PREDICTED: uncharacterized protein LOC109115081 [Nelumbo nucifera]
MEIQQYPLMQLEEVPLEILPIAVVGNVVGVVQIDTQQENSSPVLSGPRAEATSPSGKTNQQSNSKGKSVALVDQGGKPNKLSSSSPSWEKKLEVFDASITRSVWREGHVRWRAKLAIGSAGGLGAHYTWTNNQDSPTLVRLDRFLVSANWDVFPDFRQISLPRPVSNHAPIQLVYGNREKVKAPFKLENAWFEEDNFIPLLKLENSLTSKTEKRAFLSVIEDIDRAEELDPLSDDLKLKRSQAKILYNKLAVKEEIKWRQRAKTTWLKEGDRNTHFSTRWQMLGVEPLQLAGWNGKLNEDQKLLLERHFSEEEIKAEIFKMEGDKSPGPDGLTNLFYVNCWDFIKQDLVNVFQSFHSNAFLQRSLNTTLITLIPKIEGAVNIKDFRPISLLNSFYKVLAKVLAERLKGVIGSMVSDKQFAFVPGRQMLDSVLIANELTDSRKREGIPGLAVCSKRAALSGLWEGFALAPGKEKVNILQFVDDTLCFVDDSLDQVEFFLGILSWFEVVSRLKVNLSKSLIILVGQVSNLEECARMLAFQIDFLLVKYLGLPLGAKCSSSSIWVPIIERMEKKLSSWKAKYLSAGGRRNFLWRGWDEEKKIHLVNWDQVCLPIEEGGLGIRKLKLFNSALLSKWIWRFASERTAWWRNLLAGGGSSLSSLSNLLSGVGELSESYGFQLGYAKYS